ncbi:hypothetical protein FZI85_19175 [Mycobacterium sp. CBMA293]|uniref:hypothetical protein n=1 Tax=unclassified Mycolicibacterium TaxID=2636767 RepID=UPI0012DFE7B5|nr:MULTISPECIES: hypothetical protein [unclassified Mycolicibacterium]MUL48696.1 hypothetical protein [Mycolicibacterium sp. CBMA 360]MUL60806.1 hypothetical protein [Mycolicibacterium sp. CBMA 335]MUL71819.1 hypothetical protein [Mycolicibacterium sp. CBMA 311]MUL95747.1 hypothetical protein [Mycolicibacterium sp. CBMA 230]MUM03511.1 hypothetical protein [Mycolicibacterium sp. CBMA 213]
MTALTTDTKAAKDNSAGSPLLSASLGLPGPGAAIKVGPVGITLPSGYLYYGGLGVLAIAGAIEWPVAAAVGAGTFVAARVFKRAPAADKGAAATEQVTDAEDAAAEEPADQD